MTTPASRWPRPPIARWPAATRWVRCMACPPRSRTSNPRSVFGSPRDRRSTRTWSPTEDTVLVERIRRAGAIPIGKTNVPEFGMGSHTYNNVYGITRNPYDRTKSAGGSSGGAGAALASRHVAVRRWRRPRRLAEESGQLQQHRRAAAELGLVSNAPVPIPFVGVSVKGPMARSVSDVAFLLSIVAGADARDPMSFSSHPGSVRRLRSSVPSRATRVAWCPDLGGLPLDRRVRSVLDSQRQDASRVWAASSKRPARISATSTRSS